MISVARMRVFVLTRLRVFVARIEVICFQIDESICFEIGFPKLQIHKYVASNTKGCNFDIKFAPK